MALSVATMLAPLDWIHFQKPSLYAIFLTTIIPLVAFFLREFYSFQSKSGTLKAFVFNNKLDLQRVGKDLQVLQLPRVRYIGIPRFFVDPYGFLVDWRSILASASLKHASDGIKSMRYWFTFSVQEKHVLVPFGSAARKTILTDRRFNSTMGYALMTSTIKDILPTLPTKNDGDPNYLPSTPFAWLFRKVVRPDVMEKYPPMILQDILNELNTWDDEGISDPFDNLRRLLIIPILRIILGAEVLSNPSRVRQTISGLMSIEEANGLPDLPTQPVIAILPTVMILFSNIAEGLSMIRKKINRIVSGIRLYGLFVKVVKERRNSIYGPQQDILQTFLDDDREGDGIDNGAIAQRLIMALFTAGGSSSSVYPWLYVFLCEHPKWKYEVEKEARDFLKKHVPSFPKGSGSVFKPSSDQLLNSLSTLDLSTWENSFPILEKCLKETLRLILINAVPRMNVGEDINLSPSSTGTRAVGNTTVKKDEFILYLTEDAHLNPNIYSDPFEFDPARTYSNEPTDFLGWGAGLHICTGQRLAKVIIRVVTVVLVNEFDFELADDRLKNQRSEPKYRLFGIGTPQKPVLLKYRRRHCKDSESME